MRTPLTQIIHRLPPGLPTRQPWRACIFAVCLYSLSSVTNAQEAESPQSAQQQPGNQQTTKVEPAAAAGEAKAATESKAAKEKKGSGTFQPSEEISEDFAVSFPTDI